MGIKNIIGELQVNGVPVVNKVELNEVYDKTVSKGQQLITNGNGVLGDNTNFSALTFDGAEAYNSPGSFTSSEKVLVTTDEFMVIDPTKRYEFSLDAKSLNSTARMYAFVGCYDVDKQIIMDFNYVHILGSLTTLAQDLKPGDTTVYITDVSGWDTSIKTYGKLMIWNYTNSFGYTYPSQTYTRNVYPITTNSDGSIILNATAKTITLKSAYSGALVPAGTSISQGFTGGSYNYITLPSTTVSTTWTHFSDYLSGIDTNASRDRHKFPPGVAYTKVSFLWNWNSAEDQVWMTNVSFRQIAADSDTTYTINQTDTAIELVGSDGNKTSAIVDSALSTTSTHPVQNKAITNWLANNVKQYSLDLDENYCIYLSDEAVTPAATAPEGALAYAIHTALGKIEWGVYWANISNIPIASTTKYGIVTLSDSVTSTSTSTAATSNSVKTAYDRATTAINSVSTPSERIYYVKGNTTGTAGTWTGTNSRITSYYDGLVINYKIGIAGASTTTLNINGLGAKTCYLRGTTKMTTHYAVGTMVLLSYNATTGAFYAADYDSNGNTTLRVYRQDASSYNADYPLIASRTKAADLGTAGTESSYGAAYGLISDTNANIPTINPYDGMMKVKDLTITESSENIWTLTGNGLACNSYQVQINKSGLYLEGAYTTEYGAFGISHTPSIGGGASYTYTFPDRGGELALVGDIPSTVEESWTFELEDGSTVTKQVLLYVDTPDTPS